MKTTDKIKENVFIDMLAKGFFRSKSQLNKLHESDAELIRILGTDIVLALTTDTIAEEIESGLYGDPYMAGRMAVIVNLSDLSAVGAEPAGLLLSEVIPDGTEKDYISELQRGISETCNEAGTYVLGGDTNSGRHIQIGATAIGIIHEGKIITRRGCKDGDVLFTSGKLGAGNAFAFLKIMAGKSPFLFNPPIRTKEGMLVRKYGSCCMDTSDSVVVTLDQLMRINGKGFLINAEYSNYVAETVIDTANQIKIPVFNFLAGIHGEFELIFTIPEENVEEFISEAERNRWNPLRIGIVIPEQEIIFNNGKGYIKPYTEYIRNLYEDNKDNIIEYAEKLIKYSIALERSTENLSLQGREKI